MKVLVLNCGSSSIKYRLFRIEDWRVLASGLLEQIGQPEACLIQRVQQAATEKLLEVRRQITLSDHRQGLELIMAGLLEAGVLQNAAELTAIGHRVVHGGETFKAPALITAEVMAAIRQVIPLAPLHNPANLLGIEVTLSYAPKVPQVAVFDTAFHQSMPSHAYLYALPYSLYTDHGLRRYGFHGTSHQYISKRAADYLQCPLENLRLITLHLGNGASMAAIRNGHSVDTSMGMTPLEGLVMGTRCGDIDPAIPSYLSTTAGMDCRQIDDLLNRQSGLSGLCGHSDMRRVEALAAQGDRPAQVALEVFCYRIKKYIGAYLASLGGADALVFTGGIGEHSATVRAQACAQLEALGIAIDPGKNSRNTCEIQTDQAAVKVLVLPTDEELEIARQTMALVQKGTRD